MQIRNSAAHVAKRLREILSTHSVQLDPAERSSLEAIHSRLEVATKFALSPLPIPESHDAYLTNGATGDHGDVVDQILATARLPFPTVCLEFDVPKDEDFWRFRDGSDTGMPKSESHLLELTGTKCMVLLWEGSLAEKDSSWCMQRCTDSSIACPGLHVFIARTSRDESTWLLSSEQFFIANPVQEIDVGIANGPRIWWGEKEFPVLDSLLQQAGFRKDWVDFGRTAHLLDAMHDGLGLMVIRDFMAMLAYKNIAPQLVRQATPQVNSRRVADGKIFLSDYHVLRIDLSKSGGTRTSNGTGQGSSPRAHFRRGHIRNLPSGPIWVNAAVVNAQGAQDFVRKDYAVTGMEQARERARG